MPGDQADPFVEDSYPKQIRKSAPGVPNSLKLTALPSTSAPSKAFAVVMTGETVKYGNIILIKELRPLYKLKVYFRQVTLILSPRKNQIAS